MSGGALAFDPWAAVGASGPAGTDDVPNPPKAPNPAGDAAPGLGGLGGLGGGRGPERTAAQATPDHDEAEASALAAHHAAPAAADPWHPGE